MRRVPRVRAREPQRPARAPLVPGVLDVVVRLVGLAGAGQRVRRRPVGRPEAPHVHRGDVHGRLAVEDPVGQDLPHAARAGQPVRAEARRDEEAGDLGLAEAELVVGRERLGSVDEPRDADVAHRRYPHPRALGELLEARPVLLEQATVEVRRDPVDAVVVERPRRAAPLVAAHDQAVALLAEVDEVVRVPQRGQVLAGRALPEGLGDEVLVGEGHDRDADARQAPELGGEHPAGVDDDLGLDRAPRRLHAARAAVVDVDALDPRVGEDPRAARPRPLGQGVGQARGVEVPVGRQVRGGAHAVGGHEREALAGLLGAEALERKPERPRPGDLAVELLLALGGAGEAQAAALHPAAVEAAVERDAVHHHPGERHGGAQLADQAGRVERRAARELVAVEHDDVALAAPGQVERDRRPAHAAPDDHHPRARGELTRPHRAASPPGAGPRRPRPGGRSAGRRSRRSPRRARRARPAPCPRSPRGRRT